jgi:hypothetical protein
VRSTAGISVKVAYAKYLPELCKSRMVPGVADLSERKNIGVFGTKTVEVTEGSVLANRVKICILLREILG